MKLYFTVLVFLLSLTVYGQFDNYFSSGTLRLDYYITGNKQESAFSFDRLVFEPFWGGSRTQLTDAFDYGDYRFEVLDSASQKILYSRGFSSLFKEWQTTPESEILDRTYTGSVVFPFPRKTVEVIIYERVKRRNWEEKFSYYVNPASPYIAKNPVLFPYEALKQNGDPSVKLDLVFLPEGYTAKEMKKFRKDCEKFMNALLDCAPYDQHKADINFWMVMAPSEGSGVDNPGLNQWVNTVMNASFYTFEIERYMTTIDFKSVRDVAGCAPYDQICILANTEKYGGSGVYNYYSLSSADNEKSFYVFTHEFGHAFAGLGDEYYSSSVAYEEFYPLTVEPWEPNLTTLVDFNSKWQKMLDSSTPVPTPPDKNHPEKLGVFEGGGYVDKGVFRPRLDCSMKSTAYNYFCPVCQDAIVRMIGLYTK